MHDSKMLERTDLKPTKTPITVDVEVECLQDEPETGHTETIIDLIKQVNALEEQANNHARILHTVLDQQASITEQVARVSKLILTIANIVQPNEPTDVPSPTE